MPTTPFRATDARMVSQLVTEPATISRLSEIPALVCTSRTSASILIMQVMLEPAVHMVADLGCGRRVMGSQP